MLFGLLAIDTAALTKSREIMWKGMLAIFVVIGVIIVATAVLNRITAFMEKRKKKDEE